MTSRSIINGWPLAAAGFSGKLVPTLATLTVSPASAFINTGYVGTVSGKTAGSSLSLTGAGSSGLSISGSTIIGTPTTAGPVNVVETLDGATNSPNTSAGVLTVSATIANTRNWAASSLTKWSAALARVRGGTGRARVLLPGDSTTMGFGIGAGGFTDARRQGPSGIMAAQFASLYGVPVNTNFVFNTGLNNTVASNISTNDPRITFTGTPVGAGFGSFGGLWLQLNASGQSWTISLAQSDTLEIYWLTNPGNGTFNLYIDEVLHPSSPFNTSATASVQRLDVAGLADATHTVRFEWVSGAAYVGGAGGFRSTVLAIDIINGGYVGSTSTQWANSSGGAMLAFMKKLGGDLSVLNLGINDWNATADPTNYGTNMTTIIAGLRAAPISGDVVMVVPNPTNASGTAATQAAYQAKLQERSDTLAVPLYDFQQLDASYAAMQGAGRMFDTTHPNLSGYQYNWVPLSQAIQAVVA